MTQVAGLLPVFKPLGMTSKDVSRRILKRFGKIKIGHVGTLDPDADGVLTVLIGAATKLQDYLLDMNKSYAFTIRFGSATTTLDASGEVVSTADFSHISKADIENAALNFIGKISQIPPMYSAVKFKGKELYKYARQQEKTEIDCATLARDVYIYKIEVLDFDGQDASLICECSKGTYVRTLAVDIATKVGTVGHVTKLRRSASSGIDINECQPLDAITDEKYTIDQFMIPLNKISIGLPIFTSNDNVQSRRFLDGQRVKLEAKFFLEFSKGCQDFNVSPKQTILLQNQNSESIGIGEVSFSDDHFTIHLKRGL